MNHEPTDITVAVLKGGPDSEHEVSLASGGQVAEALRGHRGYRVVERLVDRPSVGDLQELGADVIFPVLHGPWGEGGPLQERLEASGIPFVGCGSRAAATGMNKDATKRACVRSGIPTPDWQLVESGGSVTIPAPCVIKPVDEGSSFGVRLCHDERQATLATEELRDSGRSVMRESLIRGRELTVGIVGQRVLPIIEIRSAGHFYDYHAKYVSEETEYLLRPSLPQEVEADCRRHALRLWRELGARDVGRIDFLFDGTDCWVLEINTMPGFTEHSLVPMAARHDGMDMTTLCSSLVEMARDRAGDHSTGLAGGAPLNRIGASRP